MPVRAVQPSRANTVPWPDEAVARYTANGYWEGLSLGEHLYAAADAAADAVCLVDGELRLSFRDLMARADGAAVRLRALGLRADDRVVVQLPNCWEFVVLTVACLRLGAIPVMALSAHRRQEISSMAALAEARAIVVPDTLKGFDHQAMAHEVADTTASVEQILVVGSDIRVDSVDLRSLCRPADDAVQVRRELDRTAPDGAAVALFLLSGGTTGLPKLIARTHNDYAYMARRAAQLCGLGPDTVYLAVLPLGHGYPMAGPGVLGTLMSGGRVVITSSPAPERAFAAIERERVTMTSLVPAAAQRWLEYREADPVPDLSSLRLLQVAGSRLADHVARQINPALGCTLQQVYGMAEGLLCLTRPDDPEEVICHTQGRPICPDDEILLVDDHGEPVPAGERGVLLTRGPYTPRGYYRAEELNARAFIGEGWYSTGDVVRQRPDGNLVVEGRDKDVINRGGEKIWAEEVENFAYQVDGVSLAAAVAMPDPELGERVCLYVVSYPGRTVGLADVQAVMERAGVARFKLPERLVLVDSLPSTAVGKIDKKGLRADISLRLSTQPATAEHRTGSVSA
ncbi:MAG: AMP-binding protein [Actinobacteria bacterium]|nr:AMP-binding protein [Actinomycetota bacterium]MBI3686968.1 AMP-binding protein [Actinomycetota bacterium]